GPKMFSNFTNQYPLSKTLRFELKPVGKTLEHIEKKGLLEQDEKRAEDYKKVKKIIDEYHKDFIEEALNNVKLNGEGLEEYYELYFKKNKDDKDKKKKEFEKIQDNLRKQIVEAFKNHEKYKNLFKKELIKEDLPNWLKNSEDTGEEDKETVEKFKNFTTYFTGFHENRKNMYSDEEKSTAIAYRLIHENLPKFLDNMKVFEKIKEKHPEAEQLEKTLKDLGEEEVLGGNNVEDIFSLDYFNHTLTQSGIDIYNTIIGGKTEEDGNKKIQGLNEYINLYRQKNNEKNRKLPKLKPLYKQILSDRESLSFIPEAFENDEELLEAIEEFYENLNFSNNNEATNVLEKLKELLSNLADYDLNKIYIRNDTSLTDISQKIFGDWSVIKDALNAHYDQTYPKKKKKKSKEKLEEKREKWLKKQKYFSIAELQEALDSYCKESDESKEQKENSIADYFKTLAQTKNETDKKTDLIENIKSKYQYPNDKKLAQDKEFKDVEKIKAFLDSIMNLQHFVKPLHLVKGGSAGAEMEKDEAFYSEFEALYEELSQVIPLYNKVRNYLTQKPYSTEKIKLNFENSTLLDGWDVNKETDNTSVLLRKDGLYYLGIMNKKHNKVFENIPESNENDKCYEKMDYKLLPGANKMLPKVFFSNKNIDYFNPSAEILEIYENGTHKKSGDNFNLDDCHKLIDFFKESINKHEDWKKFGFKFSPTSSYEDISGFYREVEQQGYKISFKNISESYIDELVDEGKLYLFQIYNKDFSPYSKGKPNLHTLYWKALFDEENLKDVVYKLNGEAEVFYRKASINETIVHKANEPIKNKNPLNPKKQSTFEYDIIKDRRYTVDKFQFHVPITMNFKAEGNSNINDEVNEFLKGNAPDVNIIGIDRGERHLLYLTLIDQKGKIVEQDSLNTITNEHNETDYHALLDDKEKERDKARKSWGTIENIKELKEGYLSQVVHKIAKLMVEHNAIVVMEDLNFGFKRGRFKVEKQVYQKFEKMLIDKLNYLVDKDKEPNEPGGLLNAYQLTNKFESFQKMGKQSGFLFYVPAWNTSKIDPTTGFVNLFHPRYENVEKAKEFFNKFDSIRYNSEKDYFEFAFDYNNFTEKAEGTKWTVCTYGERIKTYRNADKNNQWDSKEVNVTEEFKNLFDEYNIDYKNGNDLKEAILSQDDADFFKSLLHLLRLTLQMRNSITGTEIDYIISPVANENGEFFDSRKADESLPKDADANGAYHIARKGLWVLEQIKQTDDLKKVNLAISNKEWLEFVQERKN
uniref:ReChb n=1 Tax=synthetic construct TaxID=32630 RepID=UPI0035F21D55